MASKSSENELVRGLRESAAGIEVLRSLWPNAFPQKGHLVRPLVSGIIGQIAERTGWSPRYTTGVLRGWKLRRAYCDAILRYDYRFTLDDEEVAEAVVEDAAREQARTHWRGSRHDGGGPSKEKQKEPYLPTSFG